MYSHKVVDMPSQCVQWIVNTELSFAMLANCVSVVCSCTCTATYKKQRFDSSYSYWKLYSLGRLHLMTKRLSRRVHMMSYLQRMACMLQCGIWS